MRRLRGYNEGLCSGRLWCRVGNPRGVGIGVKSPGEIRGGGLKGNPGSLKEPESPAGGTGSCSQQVTSALEGETRARLPVASPRGFTNREIVK